MKAILTLLFVILIGVVALAKEVGYSDLDYDKVETIKIGTLLVTSDGGALSSQKMEATQENRVVFLHKFKNSRIKKALAFRTKRNKAKLA